WAGKVRRWLPNKVGPPKLVEGAASVASAVAFGVIWVNLKDQTTTTLSAQAAVTAGIAFLITLVLFIALRSFVSFTTTEADGSHRDLLGGLWLNSTARARRREKPRSRSELLEGMNYNVESMFSAPSRIAAELSLALCYIFMLTSSVLALSAVGFLIEET